MHTQCTKCNRVILEEHADEDGRCCYCPKKEDKPKKTEKAKKEKGEE
jgi:hypothetical protein